MRKTIRSGFTLVELLVVITIIVILMSILLPALKKVKVIVGQGMCAKQLQTINQGFHAYSMEFNDKLPFVSGTANLPNSYAIDGFVAKPNGFGCVYEAKLFENHDLLYCPAGVTGTDMTYGPRDSYMENFREIFEQRQWLGVDYSISYTSNEAGTGYSAYPEVIICPKDTVENLHRNRAGMLVVEAGKSLIFEREKVLAAARKYRIVVIELTIDD